MEKRFTVTDIRLHSLIYTKHPIHSAVGDKGAVTVHTDYRFQSVHDESKLEYTGILGARLYGESVPYEVTVEMLGTFLFEQPPMEEEERIFTSSASPQILFPYLREIVSDILRRAGYPALYLHPVNFQNAKIIQEE
jgi:preprotein translocase subunit SecB